MISVIIPTYNEQDNIGDLLHSISDDVAEEVEVIVVDGGSVDQTTDIVNAFRKIKLIKSAKGRAIQFNKGAKHSQGDLLFFIHADSILPIEWKNQIITTLEGKEVIAGTFYLKFDREGFWYNLYSWFSKMKNTLFTYGDQGLFVKKKKFYEIGKYPELPIMEDYEVITRLKKIGNVVKLDTPIITSSRKFLKNGVVLQQLKNMVIVFFYILGVSPSLLAKWYYN